jgi:mannose-1-phosphate guanylyltransferase
MLPCGRFYRPHSINRFLSAEENMRRSVDQQDRCAIVLAAGEGKRLEPLVRQLRGDALPKQYVTFIGRRSMLEHTFARAETIIPRERVYTVVSSAHQSYAAARRQLAGRAPGTVIEQPENKETAAGILLPLMHIYKRHPEATVAVFPSDHFVYEEDLFMSHIAIAFHAVEQNPKLFVLLGLEPSEPESEYGYILPSGAGDGDRSELVIQRVGRFVEKPCFESACELIGTGALWNTMVMVFKIKNLLAIVEKIKPGLYAAFQEVLNAIGTSYEKRRIEEIYNILNVENFSRCILEKLPLYQPAALSVLAVRGVLWSDWGLPRAIEKVLRTIDNQERVGASDGRLWKAFNDRLQLGSRRSELAETTKRAARREHLRRFTGRVAALPPTR